MQIIGLTGQARAGKSYIAQYVAKQAFEKGMVPVFISFAGALKRAAAEAGFPKETQPEGYRHFCQTVGAQRRAEDPYYWVKITMEEIAEAARQEIEALESGSTNWERVIIIDDVRYRNEVEAIIWMGGSIGHVMAGSRLPERLAEWRQHESENLAKEIDRLMAMDIALLSEPGAPFDDFQGQEAHIFILNNDGRREEIEWLVDKHLDFLLGLKVMDWATVKKVNKKAHKDPSLDPTAKDQVQREIDNFTQAMKDLFRDLGMPEKDSGWEETKDGFSPPDEDKD